MEIETNNLSSDNLNQNSTTHLSVRKNFRFKQNGIYFRTKQKYVWVALGILVIGLILTVILANYTQHQVEAQTKEEFSSDCNEIAAKISDRLHAHALLLRSCAALFAASDTVKRREWKIFIENAKIEKNLPGIQRVGFLLIIPKNKLQQHILNIRKQGFSGYDIFPEGNRNVYTSVIYLEPSQGSNPRDLGYDMFTDPTRRKAMEQSCDADLATLSGKVILMKDGNEKVQFGTLMYVPVYHNGLIVNTEEERRNAILGWVYIPYVMDDLMKGILGSWDLKQNDRIRLKLYDSTLSTASLLYDSQSADSLKGNSSPSRTYSMTIEFHNKRWVLAFTQNSNLTPFLRSKAFIVLVSGTLISVLIFFLSLALFGTSWKARQIARQLTVSLKENAERYKNLSGLLESIIDHIPGLLFYKDKKNNFIRVNKYIAQSHGKDKSEIEGKNLNEIFSKEIAEKYYEDDLTVINSGVAKLNIEERWETREEVRWLNTNKIPFTDTKGEIIGIIGISIDITDRKKAEEELKSTTELLERTAEIAMVGGWELDLQTKKRLWSAEICQILEIDPHSIDSLGGEANFSFYAPEAQQTVKQAFQAGIDFGTPFDMEFQMITAKGRHIWVRDQGNFLRENGKTIKVYGVMQDITRRKEEELLKMQTLDLLKKIASRVPGVVYQYKLRSDGSSCFPFASEAINQIYRVTPEEVKEDASKVFANLHPDDFEGVAASIQKSAIELTPWQYEYRVKFEDGVIRWLYGNAIPQKEIDGSVLWHGFITDITNRKKSEDALKLSESKLRAILDNSFDAIGIHIDGYWEICNPATVRLFGYTSQKELIGTSIFTVIDPSEHERIKDFASKRANGLFTPSTYLTLGKKNDGKVFDLEVSVSCYKQENRVHVLLILRDISARKHSEDEMLRLNKELRELSKHLQNIREEERSSIAKEIHDEFAQNLVALHMNANWLKNNLKNNTPKTTGIIEEQIEITNSVITTSRALFNSLHPSMLDELGLEAAIKWQAKSKLKLSNIKFIINTNIGEEQVPKEISLGFFRIFQECLTNILRHAKATKMDIDIIKNDKEVMMNINDNGIGFDMNTVDLIHSHGLLGMRERVYAMNGILIINSAIGKGTTINIKVPVL